MISKDTWNNVLNTSQRRKVIDLLYPDQYESTKEEWSQKITTKLTERHKAILKAVKQVKDSKRYEVTVTTKI